MKNEISRIVCAFLLSFGPLCFATSVYASDDETITIATIEINESRQTITRLTTILSQLKYPGTAPYLIETANVKISNADSYLNQVIAAKANQQTTLSAVSAAQKKHDDAKAALYNFDLWWQTQYVPNLEALYNQAWIDWQSKLALGQAAPDEEKAFKEIQATRQNPQMFYLERRAPLLKAWEDALAELNQANLAASQGTAVNDPIAILRGAVAEMNSAVSQASSEIDRMVTYELAQVTTFQNTKGIAKAQELTSKNEQQKFLEQQVFENVRATVALIGPINQQLIRTITTLVQSEIESNFELQNQSNAVVSALNTDPRQLTSRQIDEIKASANSILSSSQPGSVEYLEAMKALMQLATADDVVISEELAQVPIVGSVAQVAVGVVNTVSNAGADLPPQVREKSEKVIVSAVIAGQLTQVTLVSSTLATNSVLNVAQAGLSASTAVASSGVSGANALRKQ